MRPAKRLAIFVLASLSATTGLGACGDPSVQVSFDVPDGYRAQVSSVSLQVLVPPVGSPFDCDQLAFQEVSEDILASSLVQEVVVDRGSSAALSGIPRLGDKLFYARGWDQDGGAVVAGCTLLSDVEETTTVEIAGAPVVEFPSQSGDPGLPLSDVVLRLTDVLNQRLPDIEVRWSVIGPGGETLDGSVFSGPNGELTVVPQMPALPGPALLDVKVKWAKTPMPAILGFGNPAPMLERMLAGASTNVLRLPTSAQYHVGPIGPAGEMGLAALGPVDGLGGGRNIYIAYWDPTATPGPFREASASLTAAAVIALGAYREGARDHIVAIGLDKWIEIGPDGSMIERAGIGAAARRILSIGPCDGAGSDQLLVSFTDRSLGAYTTTGSLISGSPWVSSAAPGNPVASGCVGNDGDRDRTLVFGGQPTQMGNTSQSVMVEMDKLRTSPWPAFSNGVGFTPAVGDEQAYLLGAHLELDGITLSRYRFLAQGNQGVDAEVVTSDDAPALVLASGGGDVDGDDKLDVIQLLQFGQAEDAALYRLLFVLGTEHRGARLTGVSGVQGADAPSLFVADFDADGYDDLLVATPVGFTIFEMGPSD